MSVTKPFSNRIKAACLSGAGVCLPQVIILVFYTAFLGNCRETIKPLLPVTYYFDENAQGWQGSAGCETGFSKTGGDPGGHVYGIDTAVGFWYFVASAECKARIRQAYGLTLTFELEQSATDSQSDAEDIILTDGISSLTFDTPYNPETTWTPYSVKLDETAGWKKGKDRATKADIQRVLQNLTDLKIRGEFRLGPDRGGLDNVSIH